MEDKRELRQPLEHKIQFFTIYCYNTKGVTKNE